MNKIAATAAAEALNRQANELDGKAYDYTQAAKQLRDMAASLLAKDDSPILTGDTSTKPDPTQNQAERPRYTFEAGIRFIDIAPIGRPDEAVVRLKNLKPDTVYEITYHPRNKNEPFQARPHKPDNDIPLGEVIGLVATQPSQSKTQRRWGYNIEPAVNSIRVTYDGDQHFVCKGLAADTEYDVYRETKADRTVFHSIKVGSAAKPKNTWQHIAVTKTKANPQDNIG